MAGVRKKIVDVIDETPDFNDSEKIYGAKNNTKGWVIQLFLLAICVGGAYWLFTDSIKVGADALRDSFDSAYENAKESSKESVKTYFYDNAEQKYHTSNVVNITVGDLKEVSNLEVLQVSAIECVVENASDNAENITSWLEVPGNSTFTVDLSAAEFLIDDYRHHILVRVPNPEISNVTIDYKNVNKLLFKNDIFNDNIQIGEEKAKEQTTEAMLLIKKEFLSNQYYFVTAKEAARSIISNRIMQWNSEIDDLVVEVEFYDCEE